LETQNRLIYEYLIDHGIPIFGERQEAHLSDFLTDLFNHPDNSKFTEFMTIDILSYFEEKKFDLEAKLKRITPGGWNPADHLLAKAFTYGNIDAVEFLISRYGIETFSSFEEKHFLQFLEYFKKNQMRMRFRQFAFLRVIEALIDNGKLGIGKKAREILEVIAPCALRTSLMSK